MDAALLIARLILFGVFGVAGVAKLFDREGSREALEGFGVPKASRCRGFLLALGGDHGGGSVAADGDRPLYAGSARWS